MKNIDINKIVVSNKVSFGKKGKNQTFTHISYKMEKKLKILSIKNLIMILYTMKNT